METINVHECLYFNVIPELGSWETKRIQSWDVIPSSAWLKCIWTPRKLIGSSHNMDFFHVYTLEVHVLGCISAKCWWIWLKFGFPESWRGPAVPADGSGDPRPAGEAAGPRKSTRTGDTLIPALFPFLASSKTVRCFMSCQNKHRVHDHGPHGDDHAFSWSMNDTSSSQTIDSSSKTRRRTIPPNYWARGKEKWRLMKVKLGELFAQ